MDDTQSKSPYLVVAGVAHLFWAVLGTREKRRERERQTTKEEVEECALSVIGAARRCIVPAVGMKTQEFSQLLMCPHERAKTHV